MNRFTRFIFPAMAMLLGMPGLLPWSLRAAPIFSPWNAVQFNTALLIMAAGSALIVGSLGWRKIELALGTSIVILSCLTFVQFLFGWELGIDEIFRAGTITVLRHPGRMAFNTSLAFALLGLSICTPAHNPGSVVRGIFAGLSAGLGAVKILALVQHVDGAWVAESIMHMSVPTALCVFLFGLAIIDSSVAALSSDPKHVFRKGPLQLTLVLFLISFGVWQTFLNQEIENTRDLVTLKSENLSTELADRIQSTALALKRFANRVGYFGTKDREFLRLDAQAYLDHMSILKRIGLIGADFKVFWSYPENISPQIKGFDQSENLNRRLALQNAMSTGEPSLSSVVELVSGGAGFIIPTPIYYKTKFSGFVYATVIAEKLFQNLPSSNGLQLRILENDREIYAQNQDSGFNEGAIHRNFSWGTASFVIESGPTTELVASTRGYSSYIIISLGLLFSLLVGGIYNSVAYSALREKLFIESELVNKGRLDVALQSGKIGVWSVDLKTRQMWRSSNHDEIFGYPEPVANWNIDVFLKSVHSDDRARVEANPANAGKGVNEHDEFRVVRADDNSIRWLRVKSNVLEDSAGQPQQLIGTVRDVTDERQELRDRKADLEWRQAILNATSHIVISTDKDGVIQTFNSAAQRMLGYRAEEVIGIQTPAILHDPLEVVERAKVLSREFDRKIEPGFAVFSERAKRLAITDEHEWTYTRKDGSKFPVRLSVSALYNNSDEILGYLGVATDLTQQKRDSEQLLVTHDRLNRIVEASGEGIFELDFPITQIRYADHQCRRVFGVPADRPMTLEDIRDRIYPEDREVALAKLSQYLETKGERFESEYRINDPERPGRTRWIRIRGKVLETRDKTQAFVATIRDITLQVETRLQLQDALHKARSATVAKSSFLANISHEIRTPVNSIIGMCRFLADSTLSLDQFELVKILKTNAEILLTLINDVLDFSKIEAGKMELEITEFNLGDMLSTTVRSMEFSAQQKSLTFKSEGLDVLAINVVGDPNRLRQVLVNLLSNAIKFTSSGAISMGAYKMDEQDDSSKFRFEIEDNGIGISEANIQSLFKPFIQADSSTSRKFGGTGLGLSISKQIIDLFGGEMGVISRLGEGSIFWFEIRMNRGSEVLRKAVIDRVELNIWQNSGVRILVAEDNYFNQIVVTKQLEKFGLKADVAANGLEAISALKALPYDLILMDCNMPEMDGFEATQRIRNSEFNGSRSAIPIVALTADAFAETRVRCMAAGMNGFVSKPISEQDLFSALKEFLPIVPVMPNLTTQNISAIQKLEGLQTPGAADFVVELIDALLKQTDGFAAELDSWVTAQDWTEIADQLHVIKSNCRAFGYEEFGILCDKIESAAKSGKREVILAGLPELRTRLHEITRELTKIRIHRSTKVA